MQNSPQPQPIRRLQQYALKRPQSFTELPPRESPTSSPDLGRVRRSNSYESVKTPVWYRITSSRGIHIFLFAPHFVLAKLPDILEVLDEALEKPQIQKNIMEAPKSFNFERVLNFRDIADSDSRVKKGLLFRSGLIHLASERDLQSLSSHFSIKTLIDLRSSDEIREHPSPILEHFYSLNGRTMYNNNPRKRLHIPLWRASMNFRLLLESKKYRTIGSILINFASANKQEGIRLLLNEMNEIKLPGMYRSFIKYTQNEIKQAFDVLADPSNYPLLIHCSLGKDRTGVMSALVSEVLGIERRTICFEYSKSKQNLSAIETEIKQHISKYYLQDWLLESPAEVMDDFLRSLDQMYGSVSNFLEVIGVSKHQQHAIRRLLLQ